ncbi:unnamed protein product [Didymodactylos carnosus]|uniref:Uncharacterized protein n=1 Tax=Didymodactylos carnosus TaxID=1234261 RepID=A0A8S2Z598_9BILA|nr:unnamed protein product [Didymodactylos carnosus]
MPLKTVPVDTSILPEDVLSYSDDKFFDLVRMLAGNDEGELLEVQATHSVQSLLHSATDPFDILELDCPALQPIKQKMLFHLNDGSVFVKPGNRSNMQYLIEVLKKKAEEQSKKKKKRDVNKSQDDSVTPLKPSSIFTESHHKNFILSSLTEWCDKNREKLGLSNLKLCDGTDFC